MITNPLASVVVVYLILFPILAHSEQAFQYSEVAQVNSVNIQDSMLYVTSYKSLVIIDMSSPENPKLAGYYSKYTPINGIYVSNSYAYLIGFNVLRLLDMRNLATPREVGSLNVEQILTDIEVVGHYAYLSRVSGETGSLVIVDISRPSQPILAGELRLSSSPFRVKIKGTLAYIAAGEGGLIIADVSTPANARVVGVFEPKEHRVALPYRMGPVFDVDVDDDGYAYVAAGDEYYTFDVRHPEKPIDRGGTHPSGSSKVKKVIKYHDRLYIQNESEVIIRPMVTDIHGPYVNPGTFYPALIPPASESFDVSDKYLCAANGPGGMTVYNSVDISKICDLHIKVTVGFPYSEKELMRRGDVEGRIMKVELTKDK